MDNKEFDELIKSKIKEESVTPNENIDHIIKRSIDVAQKEKSSKWIYNKALVASLAVIIITGGIVGVINKVQSNKAISNNSSSNKVLDSSKDINQSEKNTIKNPIATVDLMKEKEKLESEGYIVRKENINVQDPGGSMTMADRAYSITLKDYVFGAKDTLKGEILGVNYFISNNITLTKAKFLVKESYDNKFKPGEIITIISQGGIITHYEFIIKNGIDQKFNMSKEELEKAKNKKVVDSAYGKEVLYPEDNVLIFVDEIPSFFQVKEEGYFVSGKIVKYKDDNVIINNEKYICDDEEEFKEFYGSDKLVELENRIKKAVEEKKTFSKEKSREVAYNALTEEDKNRILDWKASLVTYHSKGRYFRGAKSPEEIMVVDFKTSIGYPIMVVLKCGSYEVLQVLRDGL